MNKFDTHIEPGIVLISTCQTRKPHNSKQSTRLVKHSAGSCVSSG